MSYLEKLKEFGREDSDINDEANNEKGIDTFLDLYLDALIFDMDLKPLIFELNLTEQHAERIYKFLTIWSIIK